MTGNDYRPFAEYILSVVVGLRVTWALGLAADLYTKATFWGYVPG